MSRKIPNASEMGRKGGQKLVETRGSAYMAEIGARGRETIKKNDPEFYKRIQRLSVEARRKNKAARESGVNKVIDLLSGK